MQTNLFLRRLIVVNSRNQYAYDQRFHRGVNIIRGQNSSGKSTIIRFIFYALGGCYGDFVPEAMACKMVIAEVETRGRIVTLKRTLDKTEDGQRVNKYNPMCIYYGTIEEYEKDPRPKEQKWQKYGYKTGGDRYSFSNILFKMMGLPDIKADSTITMHQILRLIYLDQESPLSSLFFFELFDKEITRTNTAELLMGLYDEELSQAKHRQEEIVKRLGEVKQLLKLTREFLTDPDTQSSAFILTRIDTLNREMLEITEEVQALRAISSDKVQVQGGNGKLKMEYQRMQAQVEKCRKEIAELDGQIEALEYEVTDSDLFITALQRKVDGIESAIRSQKYMETAHLEYCPVCLGKLDVEAEPGRCHLCHRPLDDSQGSTLALRRQLEYQFQIKESKTLLNQSQEELKDKLARRRSLRRQLTDAQRQYDMAVSNVRSTNEERVDRLLQDKGFKEGEIAQMRTLLEYAEKYEALLKEQSDLKEEGDALTRFIEAETRRISTERRNVERAISENGVYLLKHDKDRQEEFRNATDFRMDFEQNVAYLTDQHIKLSASSAFYLKMAARFAFFLSSVQVESMMYPRLLLSDNMEDKGMEEERSRNFQRIVVQRLEEMEGSRLKVQGSRVQGSWTSQAAKPSAKVQGSVDETGSSEPEYQVIFATSNIAPELDKPEYTIGEYYTENNKSLNV